VAGCGLPVVCLPGLSRHSADFHELALALASDDDHPRRVLALDYRGRGRSDRDPNWRNYDVRVELNDVLQVLAATGVEQAVFVGTSRGGLITMALSAAQPAMIRAAVLNDIGPVIEGRGLARIRGYVGKLPRS
jgi:pimeloyl-ACP methyl ester carboxylesterase